MKTSSVGQMPHRGEMRFGSWVREFASRISQLPSHSHQSFDSQSR